MNRIQTVDYIWRLSNDIRYWYRTEHNFDLDDIPVCYYNVYGIKGAGDLIDLIIFDGIKDKLIKECEDGSYEIIEVN